MKTTKKETLVKAKLCLSLNTDQQNQVRKSGNDLNGAVLVHPPAAYRLPLLPTASYFCLLMSVMDDHQEKRMRSGDERDEIRG